MFGWDMNLKKSKTFHVVNYVRLLDYKVRIELPQRLKKLV